MDRRYLLHLALLFINTVAIAGDWRQADRSSMGIASLPEDEPAALVQVYAARANRWTGYFAVHTWIATKEKNADSYTTYHVVAYRFERENENVVAIEKDIPDRRWYGQAAELLYEIKGEKAEQAIPHIQKAAASYPYHRYYRAWPGPNSNTFISHIIRNTAELNVELPPHAIGKDWIDDGDLFGLSESGTGVQLSLLGILGLTLGLGEGIEINVLGFNLGFDLLRPALKLPIFGRLGFKDSDVLSP